MLGLVVQRFILFSFIGVLLAIAINEISFLFLKSEAGRAPGQVELVIPAGTAEKIARGEDEPQIPDNLVLVIGDVLVVKNEDTATHTLGTLLIPAGSSASLNISDKDLTMDCSFQPNSYMGFTVNEPVGWDTRAFGLFLSGIPLGMLLGLYSFLVWPLKKKEKPAPAQ